ncbi:hypothetical protein [Streptomyces sp. NPDC056723]|uniref:hypothetical protein n=1 Tax=Streptomyces sp. NPDC056723 TaxID=3345925 RepID=UPI0036C286FC
MQISAHRLGRSQQQILDRVQLIAGPAARLAEQHMGGSIGHVDLIVTPRSAIPDVLTQAHRPLFGRRVNRSHWKQFRCQGTTTINPAGTLIIIDADKCRRTAYIDVVVLHEFGHAVQFARPGARALLIRNLRNNYGIEVMPDAEGHAANRQVDADEAEAARLEHLARKLAQLT